MASLGIVSEEAKAAFQEFEDSGFLPRMRDLVMRRCALLGHSASGSTTASKSARRRARSTRGAWAAAFAMAARGTNCRGGIGRSSAMGVPLCVTVTVSPR